jgi:hypothetical protein
MARGYQRVTIEAGEATMSVTTTAIRLAWACSYETPLSPLPRGPASSFSACSTAVCSR